MTELRTGSPLRDLVAWSDQYLFWHPDDIDLTAGDLVKLAAADAEIDAWFHKRSLDGQWLWLNANKEGPNDPPRD